MNEHERYVIEKYAELLGYKILYDRQNEKNTSSETIKKYFENDELEG